MNISVLFVIFAVFVLYQHKTHKNLDEYNIRLALENMSVISGIEVSVEIPNTDSGCTAILNGKRFAVLYRNNITTQNANRVSELVAEKKVKEGLPVLVVTASVSANVMNALYNKGISILEENGNCRITNNEMYINIIGQKKCLNGTLNKVAYTATKLKAIFYLLLDKKNISQPFRQISGKTGVSLSVIKQTVDDLVNKKFVISTPKGRVLNLLIS